MAKICEEIWLDIKNVIVSVVEPFANNMAQNSMEMLSLSSRGSSAATVSRTLVKEKGILSNSDIGSLGLVHTGLGRNSYSSTYNSVLTVPVLDSGTPTSLPNLQFMKNGADYISPSPSVVDRPLSSINVKTRLRAFGREETVNSLSHKPSNNSVNKKLQRRRRSRSGSPTSYVEDLHNYPTSLISLPPIQGTQLSTLSPGSKISIRSRTVTPITSVATDASSLNTSSQPQRGKGVNEKEYFRPFSVSGTRLKTLNEASAFKKTSRNITMRTDELCSSPDLTVTGIVPKRVDSHSTDRLQYDINEFK